MQCVGCGQMIKREVGQDEFGSDDLVAKQILDSISNELQTNCLCVLINHACLVEL